MAEKYFSYSPYNYVVNNPIALIDPNGMDVESIAGGVRFTGEDAKSAFSVITGRKRNVYMDIENDPKISNSLIASDKQKAYSGWAIFSVKNFGMANEALGAFSDNSLDNLFLETHGTQGKNGESIMRMNDLKSTNRSNYIFSSEIEAVNNGAINSKVEEFKRMADKVSDGGRFIIGACFVGAGDAGKDFARNIQNLTGNRMNIFLTTSFLQPSHSVTASGPYIDLNRSLRVYTDEKSTKLAAFGWLQSSADGSFKNVRAISLQSNTSKPVIVK